MARKSGIDALAGAFEKANNGLTLSPVGNGRINMDSESLMPSKAPRPGGKLGSGKPQSPAQHAAVENAAKASVMKRKSRVGAKPVAGSGLLGGKESL